MKEIFLSRPTWIPDLMKNGIDNFYNILKSNRLNPRTIGSSDFPNESPLNDVINLMHKCEGTIVLGVPQIELKTGVIKGKDLDDILDLGTEWNHIEAALAYSLEHPLLIIHHNTVKRGIFDRGTCNSYLHCVDMTDASWASTREITGALITWQDKLGLNKKSKTNSNGLEKKTPTIQWGMYKFEGEQGLYCPVCYEKDGLKILASRVNANYYQCPNCKAKLS
jgi:predicted RNA-binding Zn-ribbon protein involved in translation (DUF1610 family)